MRPEEATQHKYFDAPARAERLQLLLHLLRNAGEVIYLRAPAGAGKTRFAHRLLDILGGDIASIWIRGGIDTDVASAAIAQLGLNGEESLSWPDGVLAAVAEKDLLIVVDDADQLDLPAVERLTEMHAQGGRVLLLGHGGLAQTTREWDVQYVDLPPFTVEQSTAFLRANAGDEAIHINDDLAGFLHHSAHGRPGLLLDSLDEVLARARRQVETQRRRQGTLRKTWVWLGAGSAVVLLGAGLLFQDHINALFEPPAPGDAPDLLVDAPVPVDAQPNTADFTANLPVPSPPPATAVRTEPDSGDEPVPDIALPELRRLPPSAADADGGVLPTGPATAGAGTADPLEAVMRDALDAAADDEAPIAAAAIDGVAAPATADVPPGAASGGDVTDDSGDGPSSAKPTPGAAPTPGPAVADAQAVPAGDMPAPPAADPSAPERPSVAEVADELVEAAVPALTPKAPSNAAAAAGPVEAPAKQAVTAPAARAETVTATSEKPAVQAAAQPAQDPAGPAPVEERTVGGSASAPSEATAARPPDNVVGPAPVEDRSRPAVAGAPGAAPIVSTPRVADVTAPQGSGQSGPAPVVDASKVPATEAEVNTPAAGVGTTWLKSRRPARYTLQLVGARERSAVEKFVRKHRLEQPYAIFERSLNGRPWYSLVAGDYPDRDAAIAARDRLPKALGGSDIWPRTFGSVQENLK